jgi:hypothetical protein
MHQYPKKVRALFNANSFKLGNFHAASSLECIRIIGKWIGELALA